MKNPFVLPIVFGLFLMLMMTGCTKDGFNNNEIRLIENGKVNEKMELLTIFNKKDSIFLRAQARKVHRSNIESETVKYLKNRMLATICDSLNPGVGLAAPQVGIGIRMILVQRFDKDDKPTEVYFNPQIEELGDSINAGLEGCLSVPGLRGKVERSHNISIAYVDSTGKKCKEKIYGYSAVIFQHEIDHLNGRFYFDHVSGGFQSLISEEDFKGRIK